MEGFASFASLSSGFRVRDALKARTKEKGRYAMKSRFSTCIPAMMLFAALAIPVRLATQDRPDHRSNHYHYKLIDMGTFGGPNSYFNSLSLTDAGFGFGTVFYNNALIGNRRGVFEGFGDTSAPDVYLHRQKDIGQCSHATCSQGVCQLCTSSDAYSVGALRICVQEEGCAGLLLRRAI